MTPSPDRLYELLPAIYRQRDAEQNYPLQALLQVIAEQVNLVEEDIAQLYENWFIETCQDWLVPYLGDLIGYRPVQESPANLEPDSQRQKILIPRREVANTVRYRRRKGTLALLEELAWDITGWSARAVPFYRLLARTQSVKHVRPDQGRTVDLRRNEDLRLIGGPFDPFAHTIDVRRLHSKYAPGYYNIPNIGLFLWRTKIHSITSAPAYCLEEVSPEFYTFSVLGNDLPLYHKTEPEVLPPSPPGENLKPSPFVRGELEGGRRITRRAFHADPSRYYGPGKSLQLWAGQSRQPIPLQSIVPADLSDWETYYPRRGQVAVDPELGRIIFHRKDAPQDGLWATYHYNFGAEIGGGEYPRQLRQPEQYYLYRVGAGERYTSLTDALADWKRHRQGETLETPLKNAVIEITDNRAYYVHTDKEPEIILNEDESLQIRAANGVRPVITINNILRKPDALNVILAPGSHFTLDGLLIMDRGVQISSANGEKSDIFGRDKTASTSSSSPRHWDKGARVTIRHTTLVPGWSLLPDCLPKRGEDVSLHLKVHSTQVEIEKSILGTILVGQDEVGTDPIPIRLSDSVLDATAPDDAASSDREALSGPECRLAHAVLTVTGSTIFGEVHTHAIELGENSIFDSLVKVGRSQRGCIRFSYVDPNLTGALPPRRYRCQPDLARKEAEANAKTGVALAQAQEKERVRVKPIYKSVRYGTPVYAQLAEKCAEEIKRGAEDESEMGVFHHLYNPQREANLRARLQEYIPSDMAVKIITVD